MRLSLAVALLLLLSNQTASAEIPPPDVSHCAGLRRPSLGLRRCLDDAILASTAALQKSERPKWCLTDDQLLDTLRTLPGDKLLSVHAVVRVCTRFGWN